MRIVETFHFTEKEKHVFPRLFPLLKRRGTYTKRITIILIYTL